MSNVKKTDETTKRGAIRDLDTTEKELTEDERKAIKAGAKLNFATRRVYSGPGDEGPEE